MMPNQPQPPLTLIDFARLVKAGDDITDAEFIDQMRRVLPLDDMRNLTPDEAEWLLMAVEWLYDYCILLFEFHQSECGTKPELMGFPWLPGASGPWIIHMLTRDQGEAADFSQLETFGLARPKS